MATRFDDTTADHKWSTAGNWSAGLPDAADAVTIGAAVTALEIDIAATCLSINGTGPTNPITISGSGTLAVASTFTLDTGVTWTGTGAITITLTADTTLTFAGVDLPVVNIIAVPSGADTHALVMGTGASFSQLNITHNGDNQFTVFTISDDFSIGDSSSWLGGGAGQDNPAYRPFIASSSPKTQRTITVTAASKTLTFTDIDLRDINIATTNSPTITGTRVGNCGGNTNVGISTPKTVYIDYGVTSPSWINNIWATSSGGGDNSLNNFPLPQDTAVIDDLSFDTTGRIISASGVRLCNIDASGLTEAQRFDVGALNVFYGDIIASSSLEIRGTGTTYTWTLDARVASTLSINIANWSASYPAPININSWGGTVQLAANLTGVNTLTLTNGNFDLNGQTLKCTTFSSSNSNTRELQFHGGKIVDKGLTGTIFNISTTTGLTVHDAGGIDIGESTETLTGDCTLAFGSAPFTFGDLSFKKYAGNYKRIISGVGNTFGPVTQETPDAA